MTFWHNTFLYLVQELLMYGFYRPDISSIPQENSPMLSNRMLWVTKYHHLYLK